MRNDTGLVGLRVTSKRKNWRRARSTRSESWSTWEICSDRLQESGICRIGRPLRLCPVYTRRPWCTGCEHVLVKRHRIRQSCCAGWRSRRSKLCVGTTVFVEVGTQAKPLRVEVPEEACSDNRAAEIAHIDLHLRTNAACRWMLNVGFRVQSAGRSSSTRSPMKIGRSVRW